MPFFVIAYPVLHSSGAWIAYAGAGYLAGTLSTTWIGTFILGNASLLAAAGLVSSAGIAGAAGVLSGLGTGAAAAAGSALTSVGLGGVATWLGVGVAPVATFLGLTPVGWAVAASVAGVTVVAGTVTALLSRKVMKRINEERAIGGLEPITPKQILREVRDFEKDALVNCLSDIATTRGGVVFSEDMSEVSIDEQRFSLGRLAYVVNSDGSEEIVFRSRTGKRKRILVVKGPGTGSALA